MSQLQNFGDFDYRYRPKNLLKSIKARTNYQLDPEPSNSKEFCIWKIRKTAPAATSIADLASNWFRRLSERDNQDWSTFLTKFLKQFDDAIIKCKAKARAPNLQIATN